MLNREQTMIDWSSDDIFLHSLFEVYTKYSIVQLL